MDTKFCGACQRTLEVDNFGKHRGRYDGLQSQCKSCRSAKQKASISYKEYQRNRRRIRSEDEKQRDRQRAKDSYAANPEPAKQRAKRWRLENLERKRKSDQYWRERNKERANEIARSWVLRNPEKRREVVRAYDQNNKDKRRITSARYRARKQAASSIKYTERQLVGKLAVWKYRCYLCGKLLDDTLHWDHVKPISAGGADMLCNLRPTHGLCNRKKSGKWPLEKEKR